MMRGETISSQPEEGIQLSDEWKYGQQPLTRGSGSALPYNENSPFMRPIGGDLLRRSPQREQPVSARIDPQSRDAHHYTSNEEPSVRSYAEAAKEQARRREAAPPPALNDYAHEYRQPQYPFQGGVPYGEDMPPYPQASCYPPPMPQWSPYYPAYPGMQGYPAQPPMPYGYPPVYGVPTYGQPLPYGPGAGLNQPVAGPMPFPTTPPCASMGAPELTVPQESAQPAESVRPAIVMSSIGSTPPAATPLPVAAQPFAEAPPQPVASVPYTPVVPSAPRTVSPIPSQEKAEHTVAENPWAIPARPQPVFQPPQTDTQPAVSPPEQPAIPVFSSPWSTSPAQEPAELPAPAYPVPQFQQPSAPVQKEFVPPESVPPPSSYAWETPAAQSPTMQRPMTYNPVTQVPASSDPANVSYATSSLPNESYPRVQPDDLFSEEPVPAYSSDKLHPFEAKMPNRYAATDWHPPAPATVPLQEPEKVTASKGNGGLFALLLVVLLLSSACALYFTGLLDKQLIAANIPTWSQLADRMNAPAGPTSDPESQGPTLPVQTVSPDYEAEAAASLEHALSNPDAAIAPASASGPALSSFTVSASEAAAPVTLVFALQTDMSVNDIRLLGPNNQFLTINDTNKTPMGDGLTWQLSVTFDKPFEGEVRAFLRYGSSWADGGMRCTVAVTEP